MPYNAPGVYVTESPFKSLSTSRNSRATVAAFLGTSRRGGGGTSDPVLVRSWAQYKAEFGDLENEFDLGFSIYQYFANGGQDAYVVRVFGNGSVSAAASVSYTAVPDTGASSTGVLFALDAKNTGTWANTAAGGLGIVVSAGSVTNSPTTVGAFNLQVKLGTAEVEYWADLSPDPNSSRYAVTMLNTYSSYVRVRATTPTPVALSPFAGTVSYSTTGTFAGGTSASVGTTDWSIALDKLDSVQEPMLINCVGQHAAAVVNLALTKASFKGTSFVIIDPDPAALTSATMQSKAQTYTSNRGWGATYYPMLTMVDPSKSGPGAIRPTFPGGAVAGAYVRTEVERTIAKAPAGYSTDVRNAINTVINLTDTQIGDLYNSGINSFKAIPGAGIVILGARTLETTRPDKYVPIRRSLNYIKQRSSELTQFAVFEPNDERLWNAIKVRIGTMLTDLWSSGGLKGRSVSEAYYIVCDDTNNTTNSIESGEVRVEVGVALQYPAEFIVINISQFAGGTNL